MKTANFTIALTFLCLGHAAAQDSALVYNASCLKGQQCDSDTVGLLQRKIETSSFEGGVQKILLGPVFERFLPESISNGPDSFLEAVDHISINVGASAIDKACPCTWNDAYQCSLHGSCYSYSNKASCEGAGGNFCGAPKACPCTWNKAYQCSLHGSCYSHSNKASCEGAGGIFCGDSTAPASTCAVGDAVKAVWAGNGDSYPATIASIDSAQITVNWNDGDTSYRTVAAHSVLKNGVPCQAPTPPSPPPPAPPSPPSGGGSVPADMQSVLDQHNIHRQKHNAPALSWDSGLANQAESWARRCEWKHSKLGNGENLWAGSGSFNGASAVTSWYDELTDPGYDFNNPGFSMGTGHFTQVVWKSTTKLGCYMKVCSDLFPGWGNTNYLVCEYSPSGNYNGQFRSNVLPAR